MLSSLKVNTIFNYFSQIYIAIIGIVITPVYIQELGSEGYGLVGFFTLLQVWLNLLDAGLTPTLGRELAYARGQESYTYFQRVLKSLECFFIVLALLMVLLVWLNSDFIAHYWLKVEDLNLDDVADCISLMGCMIGLRWLASLYRSGINGLEDQVWLSIISIVIVSIKFIGAAILLKFFSNDIKIFFSYQVLVGFLEGFILFLRFYYKFPVGVKSILFFGFYWEDFKKVLPFSLSIGYSTVLWVMVSQTDKLILSNLLSLEEYGYFSLVIILVGGISILSYPISQAVQPRLTYLLSVGKENSMIKVYRNSTQLVTLVSLTAAFFVAFHSSDLIYIWTGDESAAQWGGDVLFWYALGNGVLSIIAFQYYLQVAYGRLKLHVLGSSISALIDVPVIIYVAYNYGAYGTGFAWLFLRLTWGLIWTAVVHNSLIKGIHFKWLFHDVLSVAFGVALGVALVGNFTIDFDRDSSYSLIFLGLNFIIIFFMGFLGSSFSRSLLLRFLGFKYAS